ncbi:hypothetical protein [Calorimonas adulescens]|jgi:hypothetical protein|uniref:Uncharacterized protein n=1 Tax=Calorimonas adulescens TaxID=2606906 RepID=A0A5D8QAP7_9THEO|nr:hypothetical protein [Calorimonas adulescens]TZE81591.1 hypothetical protein FWJ32_08720 [Calorimonas adulescens]
MKNYKQIIKDSRGNKEQMHRFFEEISAEITSNNYILTMDYSVNNMYNFFKAFRFNRFIKSFPSEFTLPVIEGLRFIEVNLPECINLSEENIKAFVPLKENLLQILEGVLYAIDDLNILLSLYEQELVVKDVTSDLRPLYDSDHQFIDDMMGYLYAAIEKDENGTTVNKNIKSLILLLPMGFVKNEFLSYVERVLNEALSNMSPSGIKAVCQNLASLTNHTSNPYYLKLYEIAKEYGLDKRPGGLSYEEIVSGMHFISFFSNALNLFKSILTSILSIGDIITDSLAANCIDMNNYLYLSSMIDDYINGRRIAVKLSPPDRSMMKDHLKLLSTLTQYGNEFISSGIDTLTLSQVIYKGMGFAFYDTKEDNLLSELFNLFEHDMDENPAEEEFIDDNIKDIVKMIDDEISHFPAFFRKERMKYIMNILPVGFNSMDELHEYIHMSLDTLSNERSLYYVETLVASLISKNEGHD